MWKPWWGFFKIIGNRPIDLTWVFLKRLFAQERTLYFMMPTVYPLHPPKKIIHFVTGGFSGATGVAKALVLHAQQQSPNSTLLVLRNKGKTTENNRVHLQQLGIPFVVVPGGWHLLTVFAVYRLCKTLQPDVFVAHGFSEHLLGRWAAVWARVPVIIQVEHNSQERYRFWQRWQTRWLARYTRWIVGVSEGVRHSLLRQGLPSEKCISIPNGINLTPFQNAGEFPFLLRNPDILMNARFARQKDHATLLKALALLKQQGLKPRLTLVGGGKKQYLKAAKALAEKLGVSDQIDWAGYVQNVPQRLMQHQIVALSSHYEGMPLALVEAMAAGCCVVASGVVGIKEFIQENNTGRLVTPCNPQHLAGVLAELLQNPEYASQLADQGRAFVFEHCDKQHMVDKYEALYV